jgi:hypothetical protein
MKKVYIGAMVGISLMASGGAFAADWSDTSIALSKGNRYAEPGNSEEFSKTVLNLSHASGYRLGTNFFSVDFLHSDRRDPAAGAVAPDGAIEVYAVYRNQLSLNAMGGKSFTSGPVRDISITSGFDLGTKNTAFASRPIKTVVGPTLNFAVDKGFFDLSALWFHESNYNGLVGRAVHFDPTYQLATAWSKGFSLGVPVVVKGYVSRTGAKGLNGFGAATGAETVAHALIMIDLGAMIGKNGGVFAGIGVDHFTNKYGEKGVNQTTPIAQIEAHF